MIPRNSIRLGFKGSDVQRAACMYRNAKSLIIVLQIIKLNHFQAFKS